MALNFSFSFYYARKIEVKEAYGPIYTANNDEKTSVNSGSMNKILSNIDFYSKPQ